MTTKIEMPAPSEFELAQGHREMARQVAEVSRARPGTTIRKAFPGVPLVFLTVPGERADTPMLIDPLGILEAAGIEATGPAYADEYDDTESDWKEL